MLYCKLLLRYPFAVYCWYRREESRPLFKFFGIIRENATWRTVLADTVTDHVRQQFRCDAMQRANKILPSRNTIPKAVSVLITRSVHWHTQTVNTGRPDTQMCVRRCLKSADFTSVTNVGNVSNCWIQNALVNLTTRRATLSVSPAVLNLSHF